MTAPIRPGSLCLLVGTRTPEVNGRVVTAVRYVPRQLFLVGSNLVLTDGWEIAAPWITGGIPDHAAPQHLVPLNDPDAELGEERVDRREVAPNRLQTVGGG